MSTTEFSTEVVGRSVLDARGERIGQLASLYLDTTTNTVFFAGVTMIRRGRRRLVFVPLIDAVVGPDSITVKCGKELARRAPSVRPGEMLPSDDEQALFDHYEIRHAPAEAAGRRLVPATDA